MSDSDARCQFVVDCAGLHEVATTSSNSLKSAFFQYLSDGAIGIPACVWKEFETLYPSEAAAIAPHVTRKLRMKKKYLIGGAAIADGMNPGFPMSPYDEMTDYYAASVCSIEGYTLITVSHQVAEYNKMAGCEVMDVDEWLGSLPD